MNISANELLGRRKRKAQPEAIVRMSAREIAPECKVIESIVKPKRAQIITISSDWSCLPPKKKRASEIGGSESCTASRKQTAELIKAEWSDIVSNGLLDELRYEYYEEYRPLNKWKFLKARRINPTLENILSKKMRRADNSQMSKQTSIAAGLIAIDRTLTSILLQDEESEENFKRMGYLVDTGRILADLHHSITMKRRRDILSTFDVGDLADISAVQDYLFDPNILTIVRVANSVRHSNQEFDKPNKKDSNKKPEEKQFNEKLEEKESSTKTEGKESDEKMEEKESNAGVNKRQSRTGNVEIKKVSESTVEEEKNAEEKMKMIKKADGTMKKKKNADERMKKEKQADERKEEEKYVEEKMEKVTKAEGTLKEEQNAIERTKKEKHTGERKEDEKNAGENIGKDKCTDKTIIEKDSEDKRKEQENHVGKIEKESVRKTEFSSRPVHEELSILFCRLFDCYRSQNDGNIKFTLSSVPKTEIKQITNTPSPEEPFPGIMEMAKRAYVAQGMPKDALDTILKNRTPRTWQQYEKAVRFWWNYCKDHTNVNVYDAEILQIFDFLVRHINVIGNGIANWRAAMGCFTRHDLGKYKPLSDYVKGLNLKS